VVAEAASGARVEVTRARIEENEEEEADTQTEKEWGFPTRIQLQMRDGAMVNLHMNKVSQRHGHTRVIRQSGLIRVQTEEGVHTKRYTSTDGRDPAETLRLRMNTYKDKLAGENAAYIESLISKAVAKTGGVGSPTAKRDAGQVDAGER
jgi:hypothetical protein